MDAVYQAETDSILLNIFFNFEITGCFRLGTGMNDNGGLISTIDAETAISCQKLCQNESSCKFFNWNSRVKRCFLRSHLAFGENSLKDNADSLVGAKYCTDVKTIWPEIFQPGNAAADDIALTPHPSSIAPSYAATSAKLSDISSSTVIENTSTKATEAPSVPPREKQTLDGTLAEQGYYLKMSKILRNRIPFKDLVTLHYVRLENVPLVPKKQI